MFIEKRTVNVSVYVHDDFLILEVFYISFESMFFTPIVIEALDTNAPPPSLPLLGPPRESLSDDRAK